MCGFVFSLVAPVQSDGDVSLHVSALVLRQVTGQELPPQVDELHHHVTDLVEQIHFVFLMEREREIRFICCSAHQIHFVCLVRKPSLSGTSRPFLWWRWHSNNNESQCDTVNVNVCIVLQDYSYLSSRRRLEPMPACISQEADEQPITELISTHTFTESNPPAGKTFSEKEAKPSLTVLIQAGLSCQS